MGFRGKGRDVRQAFLDQIREEDPGLADRLEDLRTRKPQAYRKKLRAMAKARGFRVAVGGRWLHMGTTPGRETDPEARIGPAPREEPLERKRYLFTPGREMEPERRAQLVPGALGPDELLRAASTIAAVQAGPAVAEAAPEAETRPADGGEAADASSEAAAQPAGASEAAPAKKGRGKKAKG